LLPCIHPFWVFPDPNVLLIRTHPNPSPSIRHKCHKYTPRIIRALGKKSQVTTFIGVAFSLNKSKC
jgi:hypothetical protein